jgi:peroxiredoxin
MKTICILTALLSIHVANAQDAPDFTITDIDGQSHNLYTELDAGNTVVLKFFTNWCPICNNTADEVEALWQDYQTAGDNVIFWALDRDANETNAHATTYRDNNGLTFPVIGEANSVANLYGVVYQPEYYIICPDRTFTKQVSYTEVDVPVQQCLALNTGVSDNPNSDGSNVLVTANTLLWHSTTMANGTLAIIDISGREVQRIPVTTDVPAILHGLNEGIYLYRLLAEDGRVYQGRFVHKAN